MDKLWPSLETSITELDQEIFQPKYDFLSLVNHLQNLGGKLVSTSPENRRELIAQFHDCAGKIPCDSIAADCDVGALVLESVADTIEDSDVKWWLYQEALFRAKWCAESGGSGGECYARSKHFKQLNIKIKA